LTVASFHYSGNQKISLIGKNRGKFRFNQAMKAFVLEKPSEEGDSQ